MILSRQDFTRGIEAAAINAANTAVPTETSPLSANKDATKATAAHPASPSTDAAGKPDAEQQETAERRILCLAEPIHADNPPLPQKEEAGNAAEERRGSQGQTGSGNNHTAECTGSDRKQESREKQHLPATNGKAPQSAKLKENSQLAHRHTDDEAGNDGKQKTQANWRKNCKPQPIHAINPQSQQKEGIILAADNRRESQGQEDADSPIAHNSNMPVSTDRISRGHTKLNKAPGMSPHGERTPAGTRKGGSRSPHRHADNTTGNMTVCKIPAVRRKKHTLKQTTASNNPLTTEGQDNRSAGGNRKSKAIPNDTRKNHKTGGRSRYAGSKHRYALPREVYDPLIGRHSIPICNSTDLMERIVDDANFLTALRKVNSKPDKAAGYDRKKVREVCEPLLASPERREEVRKALMDGTYKPDIVRTVLIPKKNGKMRVLGIATVLDRITQTMVLQKVAELLPDNTWSPFSFAYQEGIGVANAIAEVNRIREEGYSFCICLDLSAFFDNVPHDRLLEKLQVHLKDPRVISLVGKFLTPVIAGPNGAWKRNRIGCPQGSVLSPWLAAELYLHELDMELTLRGHRFVRYADDITVFCPSRSAAKRIKTRLIQFIEDIMKCPVNNEKTKIVDIRKLAVLGVYLDNGHWHIQREKEQEKCGDYLTALEKFAKSKDEEDLEEAVNRMTGFLQHYRRIPGLARKEVKDIARWCTRKWISILGMPWGDTFKSTQFLKLAKHC